jgi:hypothetical protein
LSHAEGFSTTASGNYSHAEGSASNALSDSAHAEGKKTTAIGIGAHAEGFSENKQNSFNASTTIDTILN